jgi:hypothetical protein
MKTPSFATGAEKATHVHGRITSQEESFHSRLIYAQTPRKKWNTKSWEVPPFSNHALIEETSPIR